MKILFVLLCACLLSITCQAQQILPIKKWVVSGIETTGNNGEEKGPNSRISMLEITRSSGNNAYQGTVKYGFPSITTEPCTIHINGNGIRIVSEKQTWTGEILETAPGKMTFSLQGLRYHFKLLPVPRRKRTVKPVYPISQFEGSWVETRRTGNRNNETGIGKNDTVYIRVKKDSVYYLPGTAYMPMYGFIELSHGDNLNLAMVDYRVISLTDREMVLDDYNQVTHTFSKTTAPFSFERKPGLLHGSTIDLSPGSFIKSWFVYRIAPAQAAQNDDAISSLNIVEKNSENNYSGIVEFGNWQTKNFKSLPCNIIISGNELGITSKEYTWKGQVYKSNGDTLVFGKEKELMYYLKKNETFSSPYIETGTMLVDLRPQSLISNWYVYKPEANPGFVTPDIGIIRQLHIINQVDTLKYTGKITFDRLGKTNIQECTLQFSGSPGTGSWVTIITENYSWKIELFKADGKEMIMGKKSDGIRYYFNRN